MNHPFKKIREKSVEKDVALALTLSMKMHMRLFRDQLQTHRTASFLFSKV